MAGILDGLTGLADNPNMALALGLLNASGPQSRPVSLGQALGQGLGEMRQARQNQLRQAMADMQMQQMRASMEEQKRRQAAMDRFRGTLPESMQGLADIAPEALVKSMMREPEKPQLVTVQTPQGPVQRWVRPGEASGVDVGIAPDKEAALPWYVRRTPDGKTAIDPAYSDLERAKASAARPATPYFTPVPTANGVMAFDNRTGRVVGMPGVIKSSDDPALQARIAGAKEAATTTAGAEAKRQVTMQGLPDLINEARAVLSGKTGAKPTSSVIGAAADMAGTVIGVSPESANKAAQMKAIGGALVMKMPRMEGPQSNLDQMLYREQAGDVGNPMLPISRRLAALETIEKLNAKYTKSEAKPSGVKFLGFE